jgi:hypothetical protein
MQMYLQTDLQQLVCSFPPTSVESSIFHESPIYKANGKHHEEELFAVLERDGSFEVDENVVDYCEATPASTKRLSPTEYNKNPFTKLFADKKLSKWSRAQRPKPVSEEAKPALDPYRRNEMRKKHITMVDRECNVDASSPSSGKFVMEKNSNLDENRVYDDTVILGIEEKEEINVRYCPTCMLD